MKNNSALIAAFSVVAGLMGSTALAGVDASTSAVGASADRQPVKMLTDQGPVDDVIDWGAVGTRTSTVAEVPLLDFLEGDKEIKRDIHYRPFESAAAFAPADFRDTRNVTLDRLYPDDPRALLASRERPALVITPPAVVDRVAMYQAPADYLDREQHVDAPTDRLQLAALAEKIKSAGSAILPTLTEEEINALLDSGKLDEYTYGLLTGHGHALDFEFVKRAHIDVLPLDIPTVTVMTDLKNQADQLIQEDAHTAFHLSDKTGMITTPESGCFSPCGVYLTPHDDVWIGAPDMAMTGRDVVTPPPPPPPPPTITAPLTIGDIAPPKFSSSDGTM